jgi:hypothetical protein
MFVGAIWMMTYKRRIRDINWPAVAVATLLFLLSTTVRRLVTCIQ